MKLIPVLPLQVIPGLQGLITAYQQQYRRYGYDPPWIGYLAIDNDTVKGTCCFKHPPRQGVAELGYWTFPGFENQGCATFMARTLLSLGLETSPRLTFIALTVQVKGPSSRILEQLGFMRSEWTISSTEGPAWIWRYGPELSASGT